MTCCRENRYSTSVITPVQCLCQISSSLGNSTMTSIMARNHKETASDKRAWLARVCNCSWQQGSGKASLSKGKSIGLSRESVYVLCGVVVRASSSVELAMLVVFMVLGCVWAKCNWWCGLYFFVLATPPEEVHNLLGRSAAARVIMAPGCVVVVVGIDKALVLLEHIVATRSLVLVGIVVLLVLSSPLGLLQRRFGARVQHGVLLHVWRNSRHVWPGRSTLW